MTAPPPPRELNGRFISPPSAAPPSAERIAQALRRQADGKALTRKLLLHAGAALAQAVGLELQPLVDRGHVSRYRVASILESAGGAFPGP